MIDFDSFQGFVDHLLDRGVNQLVTNYDGNHIELAIGRDPNMMQIVQPQIAALPVLGNKPAPVAQLPAPAVVQKPSMSNAERDAGQAARHKAILKKTREIITRMHEFFILYNLSEDPEFVLNYTQEAFKNRLAASMRIAGRKNDRATAAILLEEMRKLALPGGRQQFQDPN